MLAKIKTLYPSVINSTGEILFPFPHQTEFIHLQRENGRKFNWAEKVSFIEELASSSKEMLKWRRLNS